MNVYQKHYQVLRKLKILKEINLCLHVPKTHGVKLFGSNSRLSGWLIDNIGVYLGPCQTSTIESFCKRFFVISS